MPSIPSFKGAGKLRNRLLTLGLLLYLVLMYAVFHSMGHEKSASPLDDVSISDILADSTISHAEPTAAETVDNDDETHYANTMDASVIASTAAAEQTPATDNDNQDEDKTCDSQVNRNVDPNHTRAHLNFWQSLDNASIEQYRNAWKQFMATDNEANTDPDAYLFHGRGIVLVAGNRDTFDRALTAIKLLRLHLSCNLPVEIWHLPDEHPSDDIKKQLDEYGATARNLAESTLPRPMGERTTAEKQFQIKAAAIINSRFQEVLYLDSDNSPAINPTFLFDTKGYRETGALFWPDFWKTHTENSIFDILQVPCKDEWEQESGQMVIDKKRAWRPLQLAWYMQKNYDLYFQFLNGDKDTFKFAWKALHAPYHMVQVFLGMGGSTVAGRFCGHTMLQYTDDIYSEDKPIFVHANLMKITDKNHFMQGDPPIERPWQEIKRYTKSRSNTWLSPAFYIAPGGRACMDFTQFQNEPDTSLTNFDDILAGFQDKYFDFGGIGGETRG
ncbi:hypothetical protein K492DRAFT_178835 [Lichtheimia hyalospora FSU 10163]|nr:hypothetical protein K492DRAFT_178835 [Lichtheimia hyalospora FSU 10163]